MEQDQIRMHPAAGAAISTPRQDRKVVAVYIHTGPTAGLLSIGTHIHCSRKAPVECANYQIIDTET